MKILQLNVEKGWRGGERQTLYCMQSFKQLGHEVELVARSDQPLAIKARQEGFVVHEVPGAAAQVKFLALHARRYDIVHAQTANSVTWAVLTKWIHRRPIVFSRRTSFPIKPRHQWKTNFKWRCVDQIVAISEMAASEPRRLNIEPVIIRSAIAPVASQPTRVAELIEEFDLHGKRLVATSAAVIADKDPETMIRAVAILARERQDFVFIHFGAPGNRQEQAHALIAELGLEKIYHLAGFRAGVEHYYDLMDCFTMSSREEALGSSVFDAFVRKVPVVSTDAGGLAESLSGGRGLLCQVGDAPALARAIARVLDHDPSVTRMTERAYSYVRREHDVTRMGQRYIDRFQSVINRR